MEKFSMEKTFTSKKWPIKVYYMCWQLRGMTRLATWNYLHFETRKSKNDMGYVIDSVALLEEQRWIRIKKVIISCDLFVVILFFSYLKA